MDVKEHWESAYRRSAPDQLSWYQSDPARSLAIIERFAPDRSVRIVDAGGGASHLAHRLAADGYHRVTVMDISRSALAAARERGGGGRDVTWVAADILATPLRERSHDLWHDRAVFHFLVDPQLRRRYLAQLSRTMKSPGLVLMATFGPQGPEKCSGLPVVRFSTEGLHRELGPSFEPVYSESETHLTPGGKAQEFCYTLFRYAED